MSTKLRYCDAETCLEAPHTYPIAPPEEMFTLGVNEYDTPVLKVSNCVGCEHPFTLCPVPPEADWSEYSGCLGEGCVTYDINRDIDLIWEHVEVHREPIEKGDSG